MAAPQTYTSTNARTLFEAVEARIPSRTELAQRLTKNFADTPTSEGVTVGSIMGGMRGLHVMLWEVSGESPTGMRYHGKTLTELQEILPKWKGSEQISPESMLWYLFTATAPTPTELENFAADIASRSTIPADVERFCDTLTSDISSVHQMVMCLSKLAFHAKFHDAVNKGVAKTQLWRYALEDSLDLVARFPLLAARIHSNKFAQGKFKDLPLNPKGDLAQNFAIRLGRENDKDLVELVRLYWALHMDHGANVTAHSMRLTSSAWADTYTTGAGGLLAGTGRLHGGAISQSMKYYGAMSAELGADPSPDAMSGYIVNTLEKGNIVPGYGHAVLRGRDPRLDPILRFVDDHPNLADPETEMGALLRMIVQTSTVVPNTLKEKAPKIKNPAPNVDSMSGCLMLAAGLERNFVPLVMAASRQMGFQSQYVWDRILGLPIERPLTITMDQLAAKL